MWVCSGTAGYVQTNQGPVWKTSEHWIPELGSTCSVYSDDTNSPLAAPELPPEPDPDDPEFWVNLTSSWAYYTATRTAGMAPVKPIAGYNRFRVSGVGDFACGDGTLETNGSTYQHDNALWAFVGNTAVFGIRDWTATFSDGVGEITGVAEGPFGGDHDHWPEIREWELTGTIVVDDGAAYGQCDDSAHASRYFAVLTLE